MVKYLFSILQIVCCFIISTQIAHAQLPSIDAPVIFTPSYKVYISPTGNDANDGSISNPVATFSKALQLIPFHPSAHVYGEIVFKSGNYYPTQTMAQSLSQFQSGGYTKNVSVVGEGTVNIYGDMMTGNSTILSLRGSHIRIENINIYNAKNAAIYLSNEDASINKRMSDVLIKDVYVDSTRSHGVIARFVDRIEYLRVTVTRGQTENVGPGGYCQWGSALRVESSTHVKIHHCQTYHNRGEGINVAGSKLALVENCISYDNFAPNFYLIRSSLVTFRNNLAYNVDSTYWRNCVPGTDASLASISPTAGLSIANEVAYQDFQLRNEVFCSPNHTLADGTVVRLADSIFIYNNVFIMAPFYMIDESFGNFFCLDIHSNNFSNIYIENNTFIGDIAPDYSYQNHRPMLTFIFNPEYFQGCFLSGTAAYRVHNIVFKNNIVSNQQYVGGEKVDPVHVMYGGRPCNGGSLGSKFSTSNNLWHHDLPQIVDHYVSSSTKVPNFFYNASTDIVNNDLLTYCSPDNLSPLRPIANVNTNHFNKLAPVSSYISHDFSGYPRNTSASNVGAFEWTSSTKSHDLQLEIPFSIYPNPSQGQFQIKWLQDLSLNDDWQVVDISGKSLNVSIQKSNTGMFIDLSAYPSGVYFVSLQTKAGRHVVKLVKL